MISHRTEGRMRGDGPTVPKKPESRIRTEQMRDAFKVFARQAEDALTSLEKKAEGMPVVKAVIKGAREKIREIRAYATEQGVLATIEYSKELSGQKKEVLKRTFETETEALVAILDKANLFEEPIASLISEIGVGDSILAFEPTSDKSIPRPLSRHQKEFYKTERARIQRIVDIYIQQLRKDALRESKGKRESKTVIEIAQEITERSAAKNPNLTPKKKQEYIKRLMRAHTQRHTERDQTILFHAKMVVLEDIVRGKYPLDADFFKIARNDFRALVQNDGISPSEEFPPDMSFLYGHTVMDNADRMDHVEGFTMELIKTLAGKRK